MTAQVSKKSVTNPQSKLFIITFNLKVTDGVVVIDQDFSLEYRPGETIASKVNEMIGKMQVVLNMYKESQTIFTNPQLDSAVTAVQGGLVL